MFDRTCYQTMKPPATPKRLDSFNPFNCFAALLITAALAHGAEEAAQQLIVPDGRAYQGKKIIAKTYVRLRPGP